MYWFTAYVASPFQSRSCDEDYRCRTHVCGIWFRYLSIYLFIRLLTGCVFALLIGAGYVGTVPNQSVPVSSRTNQWLYL
ncbi:hypothetical protein BDQ94DRAFT_144669 [Aspergillus welwitschiae]|uniref:Uncharacterized protein n=1 Tax=Aspergillus welwitschiae TaxID=1341132 RepID=A0A3F3Q040_9EURO|nr:hypothetical protein BDQ94DRAFT_144669 [Aspergillus welwitschiae]RDH32593.1 hypothetical protein BDQ94DRAFT_144669 [Aspergillus welwitschiae]